MLPRRRSEPDPEVRNTGPKIVVPGPGGPAPESVKEMQVVRSHIEYDSSLEDSDGPPRARRTLIWGIALIAALSAGFWAGVWVLVKRLLR